MNKFISETEVEEKRKKRQEEWELVRKPDDPEEAPEEVYDPRSLYDRLQEQKDKKQEVFDEAHKFKNQFRGVNEDEASFLGEVAHQASQLERKKNEEIKKELVEFKKAVAERTLNSQVVVDEKTTPKPAFSTSGKRKTNQSDIIKMAVKRKKDASADLNDSSKGSNRDSKGEETANQKPISENKPNTPKVKTIVYPPTQKCVGILPGIGSYSDDSDSSSSHLESSSDEDESSS